MLYVVIGVLAGVALGFGFRGWIAREKLTLAEFVRSEAVRGEQTASKVLARFEFWKVNSSSKSAPPPPSSSFGGPGFGSGSGSPGGS